MEKIGYFEKRFANLQEGLNPYDKLEKIKINFDDRNTVEERNDVIQLVCAGVILTKNNQVMVINKTKNVTGNTSPEKNKTLLYVGGHLDILDFSKSNLETFTNGMKREILEELSLTIENSNIKFPIITYTPFNEKSAKHIGVIFPVVIDSPFETTFTDGKCHFVEISKLTNIKNFESWSQIILREIIQKNEEKLFLN